MFNQNCCPQSSLLCVANPSVPTQQKNVDIPTLIRMIFAAWQSLSPHLQLTVPTTKSCSALAPSKIMPCLAHKEKPPRMPSPWGFLEIDQERVYNQLFLMNRLRPTVITPSRPVPSKSIVAGSGTGAQRFPLAVN